MPDKDPFFYVNGMNDTLDDALKRMKGYNRRYLRDMGTVLKAEKGLLSRESLDKYSPKQLKEMVQQRIRKKGLTDPAHGGRLPIMCKDGKLRYYRPDVWSETMARTRSRALQEEGLHNQMVNAGFDLVQVSIGGSGDPCTNWEGSILSITGKTPGYPTVDDAQGSGEIFHPRCFVDFQTPIYTSKGIVPIGKIKKGVLVLSHSGKFRKVTDIIRGKINKGQKVARIVLYNNPRYRGCERKLPRMTFGHPVLTQNGWKKIENIVKGDVVAFLAKRCPGCNKLIPAWLNYCTQSCRSRYHANKNWKKGVYANMHIKQSASLKKAYAANKIDRFKITKNANKKTRQMVAAGTHNFFNSETIRKSHKKHGQLKYATYIEKKIRWLLDTMGIAYVHTFEFKRELKFKNGNNRRYFIDVALPDKKIAIECDGYYHEKRKEYDAKRQAEIEAEGWTFIRFTDKQIRYDLISCKKEIERVLKNHNSKYEFIFLPVKMLVTYVLKKGGVTYNISVEKDESYIARYMCCHNCVHSSSPFILTEDENGPKVWGRDDLTPRAREQLKHAGVTRKGTIQTGIKVVMGTKAKKQALNMISTNIPKTHKEAMERAKSFADTVYFSKTMPLDQVNDAIVAMEDGFKRFPTETIKGKKLTFFGLKDKARALNPHLGSWQMGKYVNAQYVHWLKGDDMIVFRKHALRGRSKLTDTRYNLTVDKVLKRNKNVAPAVLKIVEKSGAARAWSISTTQGTVGTMYHEYGHRIYFKHVKRKQLQAILTKTYKEGWHYALSEYSRTNLTEYCAEAFSAYMNGLTHMLSPELLNWFTENDANPG